MSKCAWCKKSEVQLKRCKNCRKAEYCSQECQKAHWKYHKTVCGNPDLVEWDENLTESFLDIVVESVDVYKVLYLIDRSTASKFKQKEHSHGGCHKHNKLELSEDSSSLERTLAGVISRSYLHEKLPEFVSSTSCIYNNIRKKGLEDGLPLDEETEKDLIKRVIEEATRRFVVNEVNKITAREDETFSKQPLLLAHPSNYSEPVNAELDILSGETLQRFIECDWAVQSNFIEDIDLKNKLVSEAEYLDIDGRFEEIMQQKVKQIRTDKVCAVRKEVIDASLEGKHESPMHLSLSFCPSMKALLDKLFSIPFELNKKTSLSLQLQETMLVDCFPEGCYHKKHKDSGFGNLDTGRKVTLIYTISDSKEKILVNDQEIEMTSNKLIILKTRKVSVEVPAVSRKQFIAYFYIPGPCDSYQ